jgi:phosphoribosyl 1,2-cyclic phosphate phosphodiesterase
VPQIGCACAVCRSTDPRDGGRDARRSCRRGGTRLLIDTPPELRLQLVAAGIDRADAVLFTHEHADHIHGIDDLRAISVRHGRALPLYGSSETLDTLRARFPYIFDPSMRPCRAPPSPRGRCMKSRRAHAFTHRACDVLPLAVPHGRVTVLAFRIGRFGYVTDAKSLSPTPSSAARRGCAGAQRALPARAPHASLDPRGGRGGAADRAPRTFFTHLTHDHAHATLLAELPEGIAPAYDGLTVTIPD